MRAPPARLHTAVSAMPFAMTLEAEVQVSEARVIEAIRGLVEHNIAPVQSRPITSEAAVRDNEVVAAREAEALGQLMPIMTPYRVGDVSYWFGVPVTLLR